MNIRIWTLLSRHDPSVFGQESSDLESIFLCHLPVAFCLLNFTGEFRGYFIYHSHTLFWIHLIVTLKFSNGQNRVILRIEKPLLPLSNVLLKCFIRARYSKVSTDIMLHIPHEAIRQTLQPLSFSLYRELSVYVLVSLWRSHSTIFCTAAIMPKRTIYLRWKKLFMRKMVDTYRQHCIVRHGCDTRPI